MPSPSPSPAPADYPIKCEVIRKTIISHSGEDSDLSLIKDGDEISLCLTSPYSSTIDHKFSVDQFGNFLEAAKPLIDLDSLKPSAPPWSLRASDLNLSVPQPKPTSPSASTDSPIKLTRKKRTLVDVERGRHKWRVSELERAGHLLNAGLSYAETAVKMGRTLKAIRDKHRLGDFPNCPYNPSPEAAERGRRAAAARAATKAKKDTSAHHPAPPTTTPLPLTRLHLPVPPPPPTSYQPPVPHPHYP